MSNTEIYRRRSGIMNSNYMKKPLFIFIAIALLLPGCAVQRGYLRLGSGDLTSINGAFYAPLGKFCDKYGFDYSIDDVSKIAEIRKDHMVVKVMPDTSVSLVNGVVERFSPQTKLYKNDIYIPPSLAEFLLKKIVKKKGVVVTTAVERPILKRVVIDAGHGGKDPGAIGPGGVREKDIVLDIAKRLKDELERRGDFQIVMTRSDDRFITLDKRTQIANKERADLFISIHANSSKTRSARGFEVFYISNTADDTSRAVTAASKEDIVFGNDNGLNSTYLNTTLWDMRLNENREEAKELAHYICNASKDGLCVINRGVKSARFYVLKTTNMPAVLIEVGFVSNRQEARNLKKSDYRQKVAETISDGIMFYKAKFENTRAFTKDSN